MDRVTIRVIIPKTNLAEAVAIKHDIEALLKDVEGVVIEFTSFTVRE